jgi:NAD(P) transhydrogenase subunit alpha
MHAMIIGVPKETYPGEQRVALIPSLLKSLRKAGHQIRIERGAGKAAGYPDDLYRADGAQIVAERRNLFDEADALFMVRGPGANPVHGAKDLALFKPGQVLIAFLNPLVALNEAQKLAKCGVTAFALELVPRISRAQSMDALSSMTNLAGYKAVLLAANALPKIFPLMMTAAGSMMPAKVFVVGAGVTGLQACATAKRLGALVSAYDVRPAVREQVESVGAQFIEFDLPANDAEDQRGYAKALSEEFYRRQHEEMAKVVAVSDVVLTTAAVPGKKAPILITADMVKRMAPRSVIVDVVAEQGGNCELTQPGKTIVVDGVTIIGLENLPSDLAYHASQMLAKNMTALFDHLTDLNGQLTINLKEEIAVETLLCHAGEISNARVREALDRLAETSQRR